MKSSKKLSSEVLLSVSCDYKRFEAFAKICIGFYPLQFQIDSRVDILLNRCGYALKHPVNGFCQLDDHCCVSEDLMHRIFRSLCVYEQMHREWMEKAVTLDCYNDDLPF